jgi:hypothetical protein
MGGELGNPGAVELVLSGLRVRLRKVRSRGETWIHRTPLVRVSGGPPRVQCTPLTALAGRRPAPAFLLDSSGCPVGTDRGQGVRVQAATGSPAVAAGRRKGVAVMSVATGVVPGVRRWPAGPVLGACWGDGACRAGFGSPLGWALGLPLRNALACRMPACTLFPQVSAAFRRRCRSPRPFSPPCDDRWRGDHRVPRSSRGPSRPWGPLGPGRAWPAARWSGGWQMRAVDEAGRLS